MPREDEGDEMPVIERGLTDDELARYLAFPEGSTHHRLAAEVERLRAALGRIASLTTDDMAEREAREALGDA